MKKTTLCAILAGVSLSITSCPKGNTRNKLANLRPEELADHLTNPPWYLMFSKKPDFSKTPGDFGINYRDVNLTTEDGLRLAGWFVDNPGNRAVILLHGYGAHRAQMLRHARFLHEAGYDMLMFNFRGHGDSEGKGSSAGYHEVKDLDAAIAYLKSLGDENIGILGVSMGASVALMNAWRNNVDAVVADGAFADARSVIEGYARRYDIDNGKVEEAISLAEDKLGFSIRDVSPERTLESVRVPILLIHGTDDELIPVDHMYRNIASAPNSSLIDVFLIKGGRHCSYLSRNILRYESRVREFLDLHVGR